MITLAQAKRAAQTMEDVFAPDDDGDMMAGVVAEVTYRDNVPGVVLDGTYHPMRWVPLAQIDLSTRYRGWSR